MSSMGRASVASAARAAAMVAGVTGWFSSAASVAVQRVGVSRRLAAPRRMSAMRSF